MLRTVTVCIPLVPVSVMRCAAAVCYSITETYDNDRLSLVQPIVSLTVMTAPASTPDESC